MTWSRAEFVEQVATLYHNLYDLIYLRTHPLADVLFPGPSIDRKNKGWDVHHLLLNVIEELNPGPKTPAFSREWRRHQLMVLRYVDGLDPTAVAQEITVSRRQYFREHKAALETVADILWSRCYGLGASRSDRSQAVEEQASLQRLELLRLEAARMGQATRHARLDAVIHGVLPVLYDMIHQRRLQVVKSLPASLPALSVDESLLRQLVLAMVAYLVENAEGATIRVTAQVAGAEMQASVMIEPPTAIRPIPQAEAKERLSALHEMAALSSTRILPDSVAGQIVGFHVHLPIAQPTVLVVDDNEDVLELMGRYLTSLHYRFATASTAEEAFDQARCLQPYAITLDLMMPDRDGWALLQILLNDPETRHIPLIVCSVLRQKGLALSLGATAFLQKPVSQQALLAVLALLQKR